MKYLEELEKKVLQIIQRNTELQCALEKLEEENLHLRLKNEHVEASLLQQNDSMHSIENEKIILKTSIEKLLSNINSLENIQ